MDTAEVTTKYPRLGALPDADGTMFRVWSPLAQSLDVVIRGKSHRMSPTERGYLEIHVPKAGDGDLYRIRLNGDHEFPDPASRYQPQGVHGPSEIVDPAGYSWRDDAWMKIPRDDLVFYELHVGTFTPKGTFDGVRSRLDYLKGLGVTAIELMPVADFPGRWNWGYDHASLYAPSRAYGRPDDLRKLVDEAHQIGLAVFLDVIYNHLGPDGAYAAAFAPMFTDKHHTPWGRAINLDDVHSDGVRAFFIDNALTWLREYHIDGLRLDAIHAIVDDSPTHFLAELMAAVEAIPTGPTRMLIAEDSRNLNKVVLPRGEGGFGLTATWTDDFHHQIRNFTAGDVDGYFADFAGTTAADIARTIERGWFYEGQPSRSNGRPRGTETAVVRPSQVVIAIQNHDQIGNRPFGNRLNHDISAAAYRAVSSLLLFAPELPLLFMGQEWAASTPFLFFTDHEEALGRQVSEGRKKEFAEFSGFSADVPDPQDEQSFIRSRLDWAETERDPHARILTLYHDLLSFRRRLPEGASAEAIGTKSLRVRRGAFQLFVAFELLEDVELPAGSVIILNTEEERYAVDGHPPALSGSTMTIHGPAAILVQLETH